jgi:hypothetical protein
MIGIKKIQTLDNYKTHFTFSDDVEKTIDFSPFIGEDKLSKPLKAPTYFKKVRTYEQGRGIYWRNDYDFCPDFLHQYRPEEKEQLTGKT